jgi:hypothetical protein
VDDREVQDGFFEDQSLTARKKGKGVKTRMKGPEALR